MVVHIKNFFCGLIIGVANIIPGVSGGTMAVVMGIYDQLIGSISGFRQNWKKTLPFLLTIVFGAGAGIWLFSSGISYLLANHVIPTKLFFLGLIAGSIPMIYQKAVETDFKRRNLIPFFCAFAIMMATILFQPETAAGEIYRTLDFKVFFQLLLSSVFAATAMIIPGISGSFVMMLLGVYATVLTAISEFNLLLLIPVGIGVLIGIAGGAKVIDVCLRRFPQAMYFGILGFVAGSVPEIFPEGFGLNPSSAVGVLTFLLGAGVAYFSSSPWLREFFQKNKKAS